MHRVRDIGVERYSCPFFFDPKFSARISNNLLTSSRKSCEDIVYENDPKNEKEMGGLQPYGEVLVGLYNVKQYSEWKGANFENVKYDYLTRK